MSFIKIRWLKCLFHVWKVTNVAATIDPRGKITVYNCLNCKALEIRCESCDVCKVSCNDRQYKV